MIDEELQRKIARALEFLDSQLYFSEESINGSKKILYMQAVNAVIEAVKIGYEAP
jgi:hypothetical protein